MAKYQQFRRDIGVVAISVAAFGGSDVLAQDWSWESAATGNWSDSTKWTGPGGFPNGSGQNATIGVGGFLYNVMLNQNITLDRLVFTASEGTLVSSGRNVTLDTSGTLSGGRTEFSGGAFLGAGALTNNTVFDVFGSVAISTGSFTQNGTLNITGSGIGSATLSRTGDLFNGQTINLTSNAATASTLSVTGTLTNNGTLNIEPGSGGARNLTVASFDNAGTTNINVNTSLNGASGDYTNNNLFNIANGATATLSGSGVLAFNQTGGILNNLGAFISSGEGFNFSGGQITGNPIEIVGGSLNILPNTNDIAAFNLTGSVAHSGSISANQTIDVTGSGIGSGSMNVTGAMSNSGALTLTSNAATAATLSSSSPFTNNAGATLDILPGSGGVRNLTTTNFVNDGVTNLNVNTSLNGSSAVYTNNATFNIASGATATLSGSGVQTFNQNGNLLDVQGTFVSNGETFNFNGGQITGNAIQVTGGSLNVVGSDVAAFDLFGAVGYSGNVTNVQSVQVIGSNIGSATMNIGGDMSNSGQLTMTSTAGTGSTLSTTSTVTNNADGVLDILPGSGGNRNLTTTNFVNDGSLNVNARTSLDASNGTYTNNASFNIATGVEVVMSGSGIVTFNQSAGTLDVQGSFVSSGESFNFNGGVISGNAIEVTGGSLNVATPGAAAFDLFGSVGYTGDVSSAQTLDILGSGIGAATMSVSGDSSNSGVLTFSSTAATASTLSTTDTFTNNADGTISIEAGLGGGRNLTTTSFINNGNANVNATTSLNASSGSYTNNASFSIASGTTTTLAGSGTQHFNQNGGTLDLQGSFISSAEAFNFNGGAINGNDVQIAGGSLNIATSGPAGFDLTGSVSHTGDIASAQTVDIIGSGIGSATLSAGAPFSNSGIVTMTSTAATGAVISSPALVTNNSDGQIIVNAGSGGVRRISASLTNDGLLDINATTSFDASNATMTNRGVFDVESGAEAIFTGSGIITLINGTGGTITGDGQLDLISTDIFTNDGTTAPGSSAGTLSVEGSWNQSSSATLQIEVGGTNPGTEHDVLAITGAATLDGTLAVSLVNGFTPSVGDQFTIVTAGGGITGRFSAITFPQIGGAAKPVIQYTANAVIIKLDPIQTGDDPVQVDPIN